MDTHQTDSALSADRPPDSRGRWWFVYGSIVAAFVLFFLFVALLYWNWLRIEEPESIISIPRGTDERAGMVVQVDGWNLSSPLQLELTADKGYGGRIYLKPGVYSLQIIRDGQIIQQFTDLNVLKNRELTIPIREGALPQTEPSS